MGFQPFTQLTKCRLPFFDCHRFKFTSHVPSRLILERLPHPLPSVAVVLGRVDISTEPDQGANETQEAKVGTIELVEARENTPIVLDLVDEIFVKWRSRYLTLTTWASRNLR